MVIHKGNGGVLSLKGSASHKHFASDAGNFTGTSFVGTGTSSELPIEVSLFY